MSKPDACSQADLAVREREARIQAEIEARVQEELQKVERERREKAESQESYSFFFFVIGGILYSYNT